MPVKPMLGGIELQQVQKIDTDEDQVLTQHGVPALEGDFLQGLGRRATRVTLAGVMSGADAGASLKTLRDKYRAGEVVSFVADIATATKVDQVLIEEFGVRELAGKPARFEYELTLREFIPPPPPESVDPPPPPTPDPDPVDPNVGKLVVEVTIEGEPGFDFSTVTVTAEGQGPDGTSLSRTMTNRTDNTWTDENMPPGQFTVRARTEARSALASAQIRGGQTTQVTIPLRSVSAVATTFLIHFRFDKGFVEPCLRPVLREIAERAEAPGDEKLLILGHTDRVDDLPYNQSLSERRARAVFAFLTFGGNRQASIDEWEALRRPRTTPRGKPTLEDRWDTREYQHILQDLGFYPGKIDGKHGPITDDAVRAYRCHKGMAPGTQVDDEVWHALIEDYLAQDNFNVQAGRFFPNCGTEIVKWLGAGEEDPVNNTLAPHRPNRRVEVLFVRANSLPGLVPRPDTFNLGPPPGPVNSDWCVGPRQPGGDHVTFVTKRLGKDGKPQPCTATPGGPFCREPADPRTLALQGSIRDESGALLKNQPFIIITPTGEFLRREGPTGEGEAGTTATGEFSFPDKPAGFYSLEVPRDVLVRNKDDSDATIKGNTVCRELRTDSDHLDVVIVKAPRVREIKLAVVAHLLTASKDGAVIHSTIRNEANVRGVFTEVNRIWRQARIRFELVDVVSQTYTPPLPNPAVSEDEFKFARGSGGFSNVVNVFYVNDVDNAAEDGFGAAFEDGTERPGCMIETLDDHTSAVVTAHQLGHFLNLKHAADHPDPKVPLTERLMQVGVLVPEPRLTEPEIATARASRGAGLECVPFTLKVTGATRVDGSLSSSFVAIRKTGAAPITVEAVISPGLLALGTLTMTGGDEVIGSPLQRNISSSQPGFHFVEATYTRAVVSPSGATDETIRRFVRISVVNFDLEVNGARRMGDASSNIFLEQTQTGSVVEILAKLTPKTALPAFIINSMVAWKGVTPVLGDPFRSTISRNTASETTVSATVADKTITVVIRILDLVFVADTPPFDTVLTEARLEAALRIRADLPGETRNELVVHLTTFKRR